MILAAGLTPAWQQILAFDAFRPGEVNRADRVAWCASGKVFNVAIGANHLGGPVLALAPVGGGARLEIERELNAMALRHRFIHTRVSTRVCTTIIERPSGQITELVEDGRAMTEKELDEYYHAFAEEANWADIVVLTGSLPIDAPVAFYRRLLETVPCPAVLDFRGEGLLSVLDLKPLVVKPNRAELAATLERDLDDERELLSAMKSLNARGAQWVVVTDGARPVWVSAAEGAWRIELPEAEQIENSIACGDAMAAAIAWAVRDGREVLEAVQLGVGAATENLRQLLPCRLNGDQVERIAKQVHPEPVL